MKIDRIDSDEIIGLTCPATGKRILWDDEDIAEVLPGTVVLAVITSLYPEECGVDDMPLAEAWKQHYASVNTRKMSLDEVVEGFPASGKALKVVSGGIACGPVCDVTYFIVPEDLPDGYFIRTEFDDENEPEAEQ